MIKTSQKAINPCDLRVSFFFEPSKSLAKKKRDLLFGTFHSGHVDVDNLVKFVLDCLVIAECSNNQAHILFDDSLVSIINARKHWDQENRTEIRLTEL